MNRKMSILLYLAAEYFNPALPMLMQYNFVRYKPIMPFYYNLFTINTNQIDNNFDFNLLSNIDINSLWTELSDFGLISKKFIDNINKILTLVNDNNLDYIKIFKLLTNQDFDIDSFVTTTNGVVKVDNKFLSLAILYYNKPICDKILALPTGNNVLRQKVMVLVSEVLYDLTLIDRLENDVIANTLDFSVYLSKNQYKYIVNKDINYLIDKPNQLNLYKTYKLIYDNENRKDNVEVDVTIYDVKTALRLNNIVNIKPDLNPKTNFSKNLMIQFVYYK